MGFFNDNEQVEVRGWVANRMMEAYEAVRRVRELHKPNDLGDKIVCDECEGLLYLTEYPCPTIKALDGEE